MLRESGFGTDRRGASEVLGAMFVFAILIAAVGIFQVTIVPQTNEEIEFKHSMQVREEMQELRSAMVTVGADGTARSVSVRTGVSYPTRTFTVNPGDPGGTLATTTVSDAVELQGLRAVDGEAAEYWTGDAIAFDSQYVAYRPSYNYYASAPEVRYEPTVLYSTFDEGQVLESQQALVSGRTLNLVLVDGKLSTGGRAQTVDVNPVSTATRTTTLETDGGSASLTVRTELPEEEWDDILASNPDASLDSYVENPDAPNEARIELAEGKWYLRASLVSLDSVSVTPSAKYVTVEGSTDRTLDPGATTDVTIHVYDEYGNPVEGATVHSEFASDRTTGEDGTVTYEYTLDPTASPVELRTWIGDAGSYSATPDLERAEVSLSSTSPSTGEPDAGLINPGSGLVFEEATANENTATLSFENRNSVGSEKITLMRINYYHMGPPGSGPSLSSRNSPERWSSDVTLGLSEIAGPYENTDASFEVVAGGSIDIDVTFHPASGTFDVEGSDFFILSLVFEDGSSRVYFIAAQN